jgi:hypothetical protein
MKTTPCSVTGLVEACPATQLARDTLDDIERLSHGLERLAQVAARAGEEQLQLFAREAEDALKACSEQLRALVPEQVWTGP